MIYVSNVKCNCGEFLVATKAGFTCPHCANMFDYNQLRVCGDLIEVSISSTMDWYEEHKDKFKDIEFLDFLGFDDTECVDGKVSGFVDFGMDNPSQDNISELTYLLDRYVDQRCESLNIGRRKENNYGRNDN